MYARTDTGAVIALIPKAGLQSFRQALRWRGDLSLEEARQATVRVMFLREPAARFVSAYRFFKTIYEHGSTPSQNDPQPDDVASWDAFVAHVRANPDNPHWAPQIRIVDAFEPTAIHRLEQIDQVWSQYHSSRPFPHLNSSNRYEVGEIPADIMERYAREDALWRGL